MNNHFWFGIALSAIVSMNVLAHKAIETWKEVQYYRIDKCGVKP